MVILSLLLSYFIGAFPTAIVTGKLLRGIDVRDYGSHNAGATNVWRVLGPLPGSFVLLFDAAKGAVAVLLAANVPTSPAPFDKPTFEVLCGAMAIVGHIWTVFAGFRGGKGVGTGAGVFAALAPWTVLIALGCFILVVAVTRYVSLGSIVAATVLGLSLVAQRILYPDSVSTTVVVIGCVAAAIVIFKHRSNIRRLMDGTENRFGKSAPLPPEKSEGGRT